jgi:hypothetical protein
MGCSISVSFVTTPREAIGWLGPRGPFPHENGRYLVYPKTDDARYRNISAISRSGPYIIVAVDFQFSANDVDTSLLVFGEDGAFKGNQSPFFSSGVEFTRGLASYDDEVIVIGSRIPAGGVARPVLRRYQVGGDGILTAITSETVSLNSAACGPASFACEVQGIAAGWRLLGTPPLYVLYQSTAVAGRPSWVGLARIRPDGSDDPHLTGLALLTHPVVSSAVAASSSRRCRTSCSCGASGSRLCSNTGSAVSR